MDTPTSNHARTIISEKTNHYYAHTHIAMNPKKNSFTEGGGGGGNKALFREWQLKLHLWIAVIQFRLEIHHKEHERQLHIRLK